jgi:hypothetical protein
VTGRGFRGSSDVRSSRTADSGSLGRSGSFAADPDRDAVAERLLEPGDLALHLVDHLLEATRLAAVAGDDLLLGELRLQPDGVVDGLEPPRFQRFLSPLEELDPRPVRGLRHLSGTLRASADGARRVRRLRRG